MKLILNIMVLIAVVACQSNLVAQKNPTWVEQRPVKQKFYIGIGSAAKDTSLSDYQQAAKEQALQDLSSEIQVNISAEILQTITETAGIIEDDLRSQIRSTTQANLSGYEMVGAWENESEYWVYYRLSKELYEKQQTERRMAASALAKDFYLKGKQKQVQMEATAALSFYVQSLAAIQDFLTQSPIRLKIDGKEIYLQNELMASLQDVLNAIELSSKQARLSGKANQALANPLKVSAVYRNAQDQLIAQKNLPLIFKFTKGAGELDGQVRTDSSGIANSRVTRLSAGQKMQLISVQFDIGQLQPENLNEMAKSIVQNLTIPQTRFIIDVSSMTILIQAKEQNLGRPLDMLLIEPHLKTALAENGFMFTDDPGKADVIIELSAAARKGAQVYSLYSAFVDMSVSIIDLNTGNELFKKVFHDIKGIQLDFEKAGIKALQNAGEKMEQIIPEIIKPLQQ